MKNHRVTPKRDLFVSGGSEPGDITETPGLDLSYKTSARPDQTGALLVVVKLQVGVQQSHCVSPADLTCPCRWALHCLSVCLHLQAFFLVYSLGCLSVFLHQVTVRLKDKQFYFLVLSSFTFYSSHICPSGFYSRTAARSNQIQKNSSKTSNRNRKWRKPQVEGPVSQAQEIDAVETYIRFPSFTLKLIKSGSVKSH